MFLLCVLGLYNSIQSPFSLWDSGIAMCIRFLCSSFFGRWPPQPVGFSRQVPHWAALRNAREMRKGQTGAKLCTKSRCETKCEDQITCAQAGKATSISSKGCRSPQTMPPTKGCQSSVMAFFIFQRSQARHAFPRHQSPSIRAGHSKLHNMIYRYT